MCLTDPLEQTIGSQRSLSACPLALSVEAQDGPGLISKGLEGGALSNGVNPDGIHRKPTKF